MVKRRGLRSLLLVCRGPKQLSFHKGHATLCNEKQIAWESAKPYSEIPGYTSMPLLGTSWTYLPLIGRYSLENQNFAFADKRKRFGDVFKEKFGSRDMVVSTRAEDMEIISKNEGKYPNRGGLISMKKYRESRKDKFKSIGLILLEGHEWLEVRQKIQKHMLRPMAAEGYLDATQSVASDFVKRLSSIKDSSNEVPNLQTELYKWALESIAFVGLDDRLGCLDGGRDGARMIESVLTQFECLYLLEDFSGGVKLWKHVTTPTWRKFEAACDIFVDIALRYIERAVDKLKLCPPSEGDQLTVLQALLLREKMEAGEAVTFLSDMLMAGIETTSNTIAFLLYNIARCPDKQQLLYEEIRTMLPRLEDKMTNDMYSNLRYTKATLKESMRFMPTVGGMIRVLARDVVIGGYQVPAGTSAVSAFTQIFRDERYFENPNSFQPERWLTSGAGALHPFAFVPFGFGTRSCIGRRIAELEMVCLIVEIIRKYKVEYHHEDIGMYTRFVNTPNKPLRYTFTERHD